MIQHSLDLRDFREESYRSINQQLTAPTWLHVPARGILGANTGGEHQIGTAERILAEIISGDVALLLTFNQAIDGVIRTTRKARQNPKALAQLDGYKRGLVNSLTGNLQRFGFEKASKAETLQDIIEEMGGADAEDTMSPGTWFAVEQRFSKCD